MKTLKNFTDALVAAGCVQPRMERSYKRSDHREVLVFAWLHTGTGGKATKGMRKTQAEEVFAKLRKEGFELTYDSWDYEAGEATRITVQAKVAPSDMFSAD